MFLTQSLLALAENQSKSIILSWNEFVQKFLGIDFLQYTRSKLKMVSQTFYR